MVEVKAYLEDKLELPNARYNVLIDLLLINALGVWHEVCWELPLYEVGIDA